MGGDAFGVILDVKGYRDAGWGCEFWWKVGRIWDKKGEDGEDEGRGIGTLDRIGANDD